HFATRRSLVNGCVSLSGGGYRWLIARKQRQRNAKTRTFTRRAGYFNVAAMRFSNGLSKMQTKSCARNAGLTRRGGAIAALKDARLLIGRDAASGIGDGNHGHVINDRQGNVDPAASAVELDGIVEQIEQKAPDLAGVEG